MSAFLAGGLFVDLLRLVLTKHILDTTEVVNPRRCWEQAWHGCATVLTRFRFT